MSKLNLIAIILSLFLCACSKGERVSVDDNFTKDTSVTSVIATTQPVISEGNNAFLEGDFAGAISYYEDGLRENRATAYYNMGVSYYMMRNIAEAEKNFRLSIDEDPQFDEAIMNLVAVLAQQGKLDEAEQYASRLANKYKTPRVFVDMANLSLSKGSTAKATYYYERALDMAPDSQFVLSNYATYLISVGEIDKGEQMLNELQDKDFAVYYNLANIAWMKREATKAQNYAMNAQRASAGSEEGYDKLARLFSEMRQFMSEAETLRQLIVWSPKKEYRVRLVYSYMHSGNIIHAFDEIAALQRDYPDDPDLAALHYEVILVGGNADEAEEFLRQQYAALNSDKLLYYLIKHISLYSQRTEEAAALLQSRPESTYMNLARTAYLLRRGDAAGARAALAKVPPELNNDFYIYRANLLQRDGRWQDANMAALSISMHKPEHFWYRFAMLWNLRDYPGMTELMAMHTDDAVINYRVPGVWFSLTPNMNDLTFSFKFDPKGADMASMLIYPMFIEPDEIYSFLVTGYKLLGEEEANLALTQLQKSLEYSEAIGINNEGVKALLEFRYDDAMRLFDKVAEVLSYDPLVCYNVGLANYMRGNFIEAERYFTDAIRYNRYNVPAKVGLGLTYYKTGRFDAATQEFTDAVGVAGEYEGLTDHNIVLPMISKAKYLAMLGMNDSANVIDNVDKEAVFDGFIFAVSSMAKYLQDKDPIHYESLPNSSIYHAPELAMLLGMWDVNINELNEHPTKDRITFGAQKYIIAMRKAELSDTNMAGYMRDMPVITDMANMATYLNASSETLRWLQTAFRVNDKYAPQYKAAFYYFLWQRNFVDAEASFRALDELRYYDRDSHYYMILYYLCNYNSDQLQLQFDSYAELYSDYRTDYINVLKNLRAADVSKFVSGVNDLLSRDNSILSRKSININISRF